MTTLKEDEAITSAAESDPDALPLTQDQLDQMVPIRAMRGRPKLPKKEATGFHTV